jgi:phosphoribosylamine--glycine ligase
VKVLVVGGGAREHALAWRLRRSPSVSEVIVPNGNPGIAECAETPALPFVDPPAIRRFAEERRIDLTVVGPEGPLVEGLADEMRRHRLAVFGPTRDAARIEGSKAFAKSVMARAGVPTGAFRVVEIAEEAIGAVRGGQAPFVLKADGLAAGKGVVIAQTADEAEATLRDWMLEGTLGPAGRRVLIEEHLEGEESSFLVIASGERFVSLPEARDAKRARDGDAGPNTGGMGAVAPLCDGPVPRSAIEARIVAPTLWAMKKEGCPMNGVLYAGLIWTDEGPKVLEFNARFGDPEAEAILPLVEGDFAARLHGAAVGALDDRPLACRDAHAVAVVVAAEGYPAAPRAGDAIEGLDAAAAVGGVTVFQGGTRRERDGRIVTSGGRVATVVGVAGSRAEARARAYEGVAHVRFRGAWSRGDIGAGGSR